MTSKLPFILACLTSLSLAVAIVDTRPFDERGFQNVQRAPVKCPQGQQYSQSTLGCVPIR